MQYGNMDFNGFNEEGFKAKKFLSNEQALIANGLP